MAQNTSYIACWLDDEYTEYVKLIKKVHGGIKNSDLIRLLIRKQIEDLRNGITREP